jgi:hypothetical protein
MIKINHYAGFTGYINFKGKKYYVSDTDNMGMPFIHEIDSFNDSIEWLESLDKKFEVIKKYEFADCKKIYHDVLSAFRSIKQTHVKDWNTGKIVVVA